MEAALAVAKAHSGSARLRWATNIYDPRNSLFSAIARCFGNGDWPSLLARRTGRMVMRLLRSKRSGAIGDNIQPLRYLIH
jgi:hypothetical protein